MTPAEAEEVFFNRPVLVADGAKHSDRERRCALLGRTNAERLRSVVFTLRRDHVRRFALNLEPSTATISLRLPQGMSDELKVLANQRDVPYQSLLTVYLADRLAEERATMTRPDERAGA